MSFFSLSLSLPFLTSLISFQSAPVMCFSYYVFLFFLLCFFYFFVRNWPLLRPCVCIGRNIASLPLNIALLKPNSRRFAHLLEKQGIVFVPLWSAAFPFKRCALTLPYLSHDIITNLTSFISPPLFFLLSLNQLFAIASSHLPCLSFRWVETDSSS